MARTLPDNRLDTPTARLRLPPSKKPYYRTIDTGVHLGYRRNKYLSGQWLVRIYKGGQRYAVEPLGKADDHSDADGLTVLSYAQAQAKARERAAILARLSMGFAAHTGPYTVQHAMTDYLVWLEQHRKTAKDARQRAERWILPALGERDTASLTPAMLRHWLQNLASQPARLRGGAPKPAAADSEAARRRKATANRTLTILKAALNHAYREGAIRSDEAWKRVKPFAEVTAARLRFLTVAEARRLLAACPAAFKDLVATALATGARYGELIRLTVADYDSTSGTVHIRASKSGKGRRVVLTDEGAALVSRLAAGRSPAERLLQRADGAPWGDSHQQRPMTAACKAAAIEPPLNFHGLRHTYASLAVMNGMPLLVLAANLGHSSSRMVEQHYGHLAESFIAETIRAKAPRFNVDPADKVVTLRRPKT